MWEIIHHRAMFFIKDFEWFYSFFLPEQGIGHELNIMSFHGRVKAEDYSWMTLKTLDIIDSTWPPPDMVVIDERVI